MELIDIIITTLSIVLLALVIILLLSFIVFKTKGKNNFSQGEDNYAEVENEMTKKLREVVKPRKHQRYKVVNENIGSPDSINRNEHVNTNGRYVVYNHLPVNELPLHSRKKFTKWSE